MCQCVKWQCVRPNLGTPIKKVFFWICKAIGATSRVFKAVSVTSIKLLHLIPGWDERTPPNK